MEELRVLAEACQCCDLSPADIGTFLVDTILLAASIIGTGVQQGDYKLMLLMHNFVYMFCLNRI